MIYLQTLGLVIQYSHSASQDWKSICCSVGTDAEFVEGGGGNTPNQQGAGRHPSG